MVRADDGNPGIAPVGASLAGDGKNCVRNARSQVARGVDRVAGGAAQREADGPHDHADEHGTDSLREVRARHEVAGREHGEEREHECESADDLRDEICAALPDRRRRGEYGELALRIRRRLPVRQIGEPHDDRRRGIRRRPAPRCTSEPSPTRRRRWTRARW